MWNATSQSWLSTDISTYYYSSKGLPDSMLLQHTSDGSFSKFYYTYYTATSILYQSTTYDYQNNIITGGFRTTFFHDSTNSIKKDSTVNEIYQPAFNSFALQFYAVNESIYNSDHTLQEVIFITYFPRFRLYNYKSEAFTYGPCTSVVPVTLLNFSVEQNNNDALLHWQTANETNTSYFNIQRSTNGVSFAAIGKIKASGNSTVQKSYSYSDENMAMLNSSKLYYRLAITDNDGTTSYSKTAELNIVTGKISVSISPNPFINTITLHLLVALPDAVVIISDMSGKIIYASQQDITAGSQLTIEASKFAKGVYMITIQSAANKQVFRIVK